MPALQTSLADRLVQLVGRRSSPEAAGWLASQLRPEAERAHADFVVAFSAAGRRLGAAAIARADAEAVLVDEGLAAWAAGRGADELGRVALLLGELGRPDDVALVQELFYRGEAREKQAVLRALPVVPDPARFLEVGVEACRSSVQTIFEAIACESSYPAQHFPENSFNQMVIKALFNETPVRRIVGLAGRVGPELVRMAEGYGSERRAAGRTVPDDIRVIRELLSPEERP